MAGPLAGSKSDEGSRWTVAFSFARPPQSARRQSLADERLPSAADRIWQVELVPDVDKQRPVDVARERSDPVGRADSLFPECSPNWKETLERASDLRKRGGRYWV